MKFVPWIPSPSCFGVFFDLPLNKRFSKQSRRRWFQTPSRSLWRNCNVFCQEQTNPIKTILDHSINNCRQRWLFISIFWRRAIMGAAIMISINLIVPICGNWSKIDDWLFDIVIAFKSHSSSYFFYVFATLLLQPTACPSKLKIWSSHHVKTHDLPDLNQD